MNLLIVKHRLTGELYWCLGITLQQLSNTQQICGSESYYVLPWPKWNNTSVILRNVKDLIPVAVIKLKPGVSICTKD